MRPRRTASLSSDEAAQPGDAQRPGSPTSLVESDALPTPAPAVSFQAALNATGQFPEHLQDYDRVRGAVRAFIAGDASREDLDTLFLRNPAGQSIAHWAVANRQSDVLIALATPLATRGVDPALRAALREVLMRCDTSRAGCSPAHWAGLYRRSGILRLYAEDRLGLSEALIQGDASGNTPAHYWVASGGRVEALADIATTRNLRAGHPMRTALTQANILGQQPRDMSLRAQPWPGPGPAGAAAAAGAGAASGPTP